MNTSSLIIDLASADTNTRLEAFYLLAHHLRPKIEPHANSYRLSLANHQQAGVTGSDIFMDAMIKIAKGRITKSPWELREDGDRWETAFLSYFKDTVDSVARDKIRAGNVRKDIGASEVVDDEGQTVEASRQGPLARSSGFTEQIRRNDDEAYIRSELAKLKLLSAKTLEALIGHYIEGMTYVELAKIDLGLDASKFDTDHLADAKRKAVANAKLPEELREALERYHQCYIGL